jgi:hypothetical protein
MDWTTLAGTGLGALDSAELQEQRLKHARAVWAARAAMRRDPRRRA